MLVVAIVHNSGLAGPGRLLLALHCAGAEIRDVHPARGDRLPHPSHLDAVVVLGGEMGAYEEDSHPHLVQEKAAIRATVDAGVPLLGICLGAQLLADALGGRARPADRPEVGLVRLTKTDDGRDDPVIGPLDPVVLAVHQDTFELPAGATLLARSGDCPHAFRVGSALGIQFHAEADAATVETWFRHPGVPPPSDPEAGTLILEELRALDDRLDREAAGLFGRWLDEVRTGARSS